MFERAALRTVLGDYPHTRPLENGSVASPDVFLTVDLLDPVHRAFAPMVRDEAYDLCELAVVTALQAVAYGRPIVVLPAVLASRFQRGCLISHASRPITDPRELRNARVGVRSYTQTTGMWVRHHLFEDAGLSCNEVHWVTSDHAHVEQYRDPAFVAHEEHGWDLVQALRKGDVEAVVLGNDLPSGDEFVPVFTEAATADEAWWRQHEFVPVNHVLVASKSLCERNPAAVRAAYELIRRADWSVRRPPGAPSPTRFGLDGLHEVLEVVIAACDAQELLPRRITADEVLAPARLLLA